MPQSYNGTSWYRESESSAALVMEDRAADAFHMQSFDSPQAVLPLSSIVVRNDLPGLRVLIDNTSTSENLESAPDHLS
ncbi:MAG: hypothetical protein EON54_23455, partial [Alcaligenaceae bacterium]